MKPKTIGEGLLEHIRITRESHGHGERESEIKQNKKENEMKIHPSEKEATPSREGLQADLAIETLSLIHDLAWTATPLDELVGRARDLSWKIGVANPTN